MERREFLRCAAAGIGAAVAGGGLSRTLAAEPRLERRNERPDMTYVRLGRTNLAVSRIAHGSLHTNRDRLPVVARLYEAGVNLYDSSHVYGGGKAEEALGEFFAVHGITLQANLVQDFFEPLRVSNGIGGMFFKAVPPEKLTEFLRGERR